MIYKTGIIYNKYYLSYVIIFFNFLQKKIIFLNIIFFLLITNKISKIYTILIFILFLYY